MCATHYTIPSYKPTLLIAVGFLIGPGRKRRRDLQDHRLMQGTGSATCLVVFDKRFEHPQIPCSEGSSAQGGEIQRHPLSTCPPKSTRQYNKQPKRVKWTEVLRHSAPNYSRINRYSPLEPISKSPRIRVDAKTGLCMSHRLRVESTTKSAERRAAARLGVDGHARNF
jgi:hypothetical protein